MSGHHEEHHLAALEEVFNQIRKHHADKGMGATVLADKDWLQKRLEGIAQKLKTEHEFVLGAFVRFELLGDEVKPTLLPLDEEGGLFFGNVDDEFKKQAYQTFESLKSGGENGESLFLSELVHDSVPHHARMVQLAISCRCGECNQPDRFLFNDWGRAHELGKLSGLIFEEEKRDIPELTEKERRYVAVIPGYFPNEKDCHFLVYCPFLVADGKPPGNFFGVFRKCDTEIKCSHGHSLTTDANILKLVTFVQMAGTLAFSQLSLRELLNIENHKKYKEVIGLIGEIQKEADDSASRMNANLARLENILNPFGMWAGVRSFDGWKDIYNKSYLGDRNPTGGAYTLHDPSNWKEVDAGSFSDFFKNSEIFTVLKNELIESRFLVLFNCWIDFNDPRFWSADKEKYLGGYIAKMLVSQQLPLLWVNDLVDNEYADIHKFRGVEIIKVPILAVIAALYLRKNAKDGKAFGATVVNDELVISFEIEADPEKENVEGLIKLKGLAEHLMSDAAAGVQPSDPKKKQTAHSLAVLCASAGKCRFNLNVNEKAKVLCCSFNYVIAKEMK